MTIVKSNVCKSCGGLLDIDVDRQVYVCQFCGVTYDYEYFREDNVLDVGGRALAEGEFNSAKEAFEFMLKKDPHNREALLGLFLCKCKWKSLNMMGSYTQVHVKEDEPFLVSAIENCLPEDKEFFLRIQEALRVLESCRNKRSETDKIQSDREAEAAIYNSHKNEFEKHDVSLFIHICNLIRDMCDPEHGKYFLLAVIIPVFLVAIGTYACGWWVLVGAIALFAAGVAVFCIREAKLKKVAGVSMKASWDKLSKLGDDVAKGRDESEVLIQKYIELTRGLMECTRNRGRN